MTLYTETPHAGEFIIGEAEEFRSREAVTIAVSQTLKAGHAIARKATAATVAASAVSGTGNGVLDPRRHAVDERSRPRRLSRCVHRAGDEPRHLRRRRPRTAVSSATAWLAPPIPSTSRSPSPMRATDFVAGDPSSSPFRR